MAVTGRRPPSKRQCDAVYRLLLEMHGPQQWWPHDQPDGRLEICLGAILTQNTAWRSAARALDQLRAAGALSCEAILATPHDVLADLVRPSGHYNVKARKLQSFAATVVEQHDGELDSLLEGDAEMVRERLLAIWGIGPETADAITLYAAHKPTFVVDAYTFRLFERLGLPLPQRRYEPSRQLLLRRIGRDVERLNEWHALIVRHGQRLCLRSAPRCDQCALVRRCAYGRGELGLRR